jgi:L-alanine-DL-glutamate epimerase-like enolase superfamily enzyme
LEYRDFCLHLPKGPGLGIEPDLEKIQNLASLITQANQ